MTKTNWEGYHIVNLYAQDDWTVDEVIQDQAVVQTAAAATTLWSPVKASLDYG